MKSIIISLAVDGREPYTYKQKNLIKTLPVAGDCDWMILNEYPNYCCPHTETPYRFKFDLIEKAVENGYTSIFWLDSTMRLLKNPFELLEQSEKGVVAFHNLGHPLYPRYISDIAESNLNYFYYDISKIESTWGGALGFDFSKPLSKAILSEVKHQIKAGSFNDGDSKREGFVAHRHDQSVLSVLFNYYEVPLLEYGIIAAKPDVTDKTYIMYGD